jgi:hypothetical protein
VHALCRAAADQRREGQHLCARANQTAPLTSLTAQAFIDRCMLFKDGKDFVASMLLSARACTETVKGANLAARSHLGSPAQTHSKPVQFDSYQEQIKSTKTLHAPVTACNMLNPVLGWAAQGLPAASRKAEGVFMEGHTPWPAARRCCTGGPRCQ